MFFALSIAVDIFEWLTQVNEENFYCDIYTA